MAIITTKNSNSKGFLTFLNTYPSSSSYVDLKSTGGYNTVDYTGTYWRPKDKNNHTTKFQDLSADYKIELGLNVVWGELQTSGDNKGKVKIHLGLLLSEYQKWLKISNFVNNPTINSSTIGYNYHLMINGVNYIISNNPIDETIDSAGQSPFFSQKVGSTTNNYSFRPNSTNKIYVQSHVTEVWSKDFYVTPVNGKADLTVKVIKLYLYWGNTYNRPCIYCGECENKFISEKTYYSGSIDISPHNFTINLNPTSASINTIINNSISSNRNFWNYVNGDRQVVDKIEPNIHSYKSTIEPVVFLKDYEPGTDLGSIAWSTSNKNAIKLSDTLNSTSTKAMFNGTVSNSKVYCNVLGSNLVCNINFNTNNNVHFTSNDWSMASVSYLNGTITANRGRNGPYTITTHFNGSLKVNTAFNSYLVPNEITMYCYEYGTTTPKTTINSGEKLTIMAKVGPYVANNSSISTYTGFRNLAFSLNNNVGTLTTPYAVSNNKPYYTATYTAPTVNATQTIKLTITQPNTSGYTGVNANTVITINPLPEPLLPNLELKLTDVNPIIASNQKYCVVTYDVVAKPGETLTANDRKYINNIPITFNNVSYSVADYSTFAQYTPNGYTGVTISDKKRQAAYKVSVTAINNASMTSNLIWQSQASMTIPNDRIPNPIAPVTSSHRVDIKYINIDPSIVILPTEVSLLLNYDAYTVNAITSNDISYSNVDINVVRLSNFTLNWKDSTNTKPYGSFVLTGISPGYTRIYLGIKNQNMITACDIYVVNTNPRKDIVFPYVYEKYSANDGLQIVYDSIKHNEQEALRLVFMLADPYVFKLISDIQVTVTYDEIDENKGEYKFEKYSLLENPEYFSLTYPITDIDMEYMFDIISLYKAYYGMNPYCIFQEPNDKRDLSKNIINFALEYVVKPEYKPFISYRIKSTITANNRYEIEDVKVNDKLYGYDETNPDNYSLKPFIEAYKSYTQGYIHSNILNENIINDYGTLICSLEHFGKKGESISALPFYRFLLSQNYIRGIDKYLIGQYLNIACIVKGYLNDLISEETVVLPNNLYPNYIRNMYLTEEQIAKYEITAYFDNQLLTRDGEVIIYNVLDYTNLTSNAWEDFYICADDNNTTFYNNPNMPNTFMDDEYYYQNFTISPLKEFTNTLYMYSIEDETSYTATKPTITPFIGDSLLPIMSGVFGIFTPAEYDTDFNSSKPIWSNRLDSGYNILLENSENIVQQAHAIIMPYECNGSLEYDTPLQEYTIYIKCYSSGTKSSSSATTFLSTYICNQDSDEDSKGLILGTYEKAYYNSNLVIGDKHATMTVLTNGLNSDKRVIQSTGISCLEPHTYAITVYNSTFTKFYVDGVPMPSVDNPSTIAVEYEPTKFVINSLQISGYVNPYSVNSIINSSNNYYKFIAFASEKHNDETVRINSEYINSHF